MRNELIQTGMDIIGPVPWGAHFCEFFHTTDDLLDTLVPYFRAGLESNEFCMWITSEPISPSEARAAMRQAMPDFADRLAAGQIEILPCSRWFLKRGAFDRQSVLEGWVNKVNAALGAGYAGLRLSENTSWLEKRDWKSFTEYEAAINDVLGRHRILAFCAYSLDKYGAEETLDVIRNHEFALIRKEGKWELIESAIQRHAKQALLDSESKYRRLVESLHEGVWVIDKDARTTFVNPHMAEMVGYSTEEMMGRPFFSFINEPHLDLARERMERRREGVSEQVELDFRRKDGSTLNAFVSAAPLTDHRGDFSGVVAGIVDVTDQKNMQDELRSSEARYRGLYQAVAGGVVVQDSDGRITEANAAAREILGLGLDEITRRTSANPEWQAIREDGSPFPGEEHPAMVTLRTGRPVQGVVMGVFHPASGQRRWILVNSEPICDPETGRVEAVTTTLVDISQRKTEEETLRQTRDYLDSLLNYASAPIIVWDRDFRITRFNRAFQRLTGYRESEVLGKELHILFPERTKEESLAHIRRAMAGERWEAVEIPILRVDGSVRTVLWNSATIYDKDGSTPIATTAQGQDITGRKEAEERLAFHADVLSHISDAIVAVDNDQRVTYWNRVAEQAYGVPAKQAIGRELHELYQIAWLNPADEQNSARDLASTDHWVGEAFHVKKNGERAYVRSSMSVIRDADGVRTGMVAVIRDRTKLWQAEQELKLLNEKLRQEAEDRLRAADASFRRAIASSADGTVVIRKDGVIRFANAAAEHLFGRPSGEMEGTLFRFPLSEGTEIEILREDGHTAVAEMRIVELEWEGAPAYLATLRDVTKRRQGLLALQESETRLRLLLEQIPCVSWTLDTRLRFTSFSGSGVEAFRNAPGRTLGMSLAEYFNTDDPEFAPYAAHRQALQGTPVAYELTWGGRTFIGRVEPLRDADEHIVGVVGVAFDITDRKLVEEQLRTLSHRLVTAQENERRRIARELHDEVGQSLTALKLCLDRASSDSSQDGSELREAREALRDLMARVRSMSLDLRPTMLDDLGLLPTLLWHFKRYTAQTRVQVRFRHRGLRKDLPQEAVTAAYRIVQEALTNVARHAQVDEASVRVRAESDALLVEVEDRGIGFDMDTVTSRKTGMNGMRERALALQGKLLIQSKPGEGTSVIAELPLPKTGPKRQRRRKNDNRSSG